MSALRGMQDVENEDVVEQTCYLLVHRVRRRYVLRAAKQTMKQLVSDHIGITSSSPERRWLHELHPTRIFRNWSASPCTRLSSAKEIASR